MTDIKIRKSFIVTEGRLHEVLKRYFKVLIKDTGSFGELLKTKSYIKRQAHAKKVIRHAHYLIRKIDHGFKEWKIFLRGSPKIIDVMSGRRQWYEIVDIPEKTEND